MIHVQVWTGSGSARVTEMVNAHKRGKTCRVLRFLGWMPSGSGDDIPRRACDLAHAVMTYAKALLPDTSFDVAAAEVRRMVTDAALPEYAASVHEDAIRGVDAPRPKLTAGVEGRWAASADEDGVSVSDLADGYNEPRAITRDQSEAKAYTLAAKAWDRVTAAATFSRATEILRAAGCRLHYFCARD